MKKAKKVTLATIANTNLLALRKRRQLSQGALADKAGLSVSYISMLERDRRAMPLATLEALATALGTTPGAMLSA